MFHAQDLRRGTAGRSTLPPRGVCGESRPAVAGQRDDDYAAASPSANALSASGYLAAALTAAGTADLGDSLDRVSACSHPDALWRRPRAIRTRAGAESGVRPGGPAHVAPERRGMGPGAYWRDVTARVVFPANRCRYRDHSGTSRDDAHDPAVSARDGTRAHAAPSAWTGHLGPIPTGPRESDCPDAFRME